MRNGYIFDTLTSVEIQEVVKTCDFIFKSFEGVLYKENFNVYPFGNVVQILFTLGLKEFKITGCCLVEFILLNWLKMKL